MEDVPVQIPAERQLQVLTLVQQRGSVSIQDLVRDVNASISTIRRDLDALAQQGLIQRTHGGALATTRTATEVRFDERQRSNPEEKRRIGTFSVSLLEAGQSVYFDSSTTVLFAAEALRQRPLPLTAVTHDLAVAAVLAMVPEVRVLVPGGEVRAGSFTLFGATTHTFLRQLHIDVALIGVHAIRAGRFSEGSLAIAELKRALLDGATRRVLLADTSKFNQTALIDVASLTAAQDLITGQELSQSLRDELQLTQSLSLHLV